MKSRVPWYTFFAFFVVVGVRGDVAHLPILEPGLHVGDQALFGSHAQHFAEVGFVHLLRAGGFGLDLALEHLDADFIDELEILDDACHQRVFFTCFDCWSNQALSLTTPKLSSSEDTALRNAVRSSFSFIMSLLSEPQVLQIHLDRCVKLRRFLLLLPP